VVIDASIALKWLVPEEGSAAAASLIGEAELVVPTLFHAEVGNALWAKARKGEIELAGLIGEFESLPSLVRTFDETPLAPTALRIADELDHPVYDCIYLALAELLDDIVVTADRRFLRAVSMTAYKERVKELGA